MKISSEKLNNVYGIKHAIQAITIFNDRDLNRNQRKDERFVESFGALQSLV